jgi:hypothetical protein
MPPRKQPPQQDPEEEDDTLVTGKQFKKMMHMMESLTVSMNETFDKTTTSMNEMFHKSQASTETTLEHMQRGITATADRVPALKTRLPITVTDPNAAVTSLSFLILLHANVNPSTDKVWEVIKITITNTMCAMMILLLKLNFLSLLLMACMMLRLI